MITNLQLRNWRAYDQLDLELGPGATFIVASNGVGKTSLIMSAAWALFGDHGDIIGAEQIRGDNEDAFVAVDLHVPSTTRAHIERTVDRHSRTTVKALIGDRELRDQESINEFLSAEFGADASVLSQLSFMIYGGLLETQGEFSLQDHLGRVFGVKPLFDAAAEAKSLAGEMASQLRKTKVVQSKGRKHRSELIDEEAALRQTLENLNASREASKTSHEELLRQLRRIEDWAAYDIAMVEHARLLSDISSDAMPHLGPQGAAAELLVVLLEREQELEAEVATYATRAAAQRARAEMLSEAVALLENGETEVCPTCLRPLALHEASEAVEEQNRRLQQLLEQAIEAERQSTTARDELASVRRLLERTRSARPPLTPNHDKPAAEATVVKNEVAASETQLRQMDLQVAEVSFRLRTLNDELQLLADEEVQTRQLLTMYRHEGLALAAEKTFRATGNAITEEFIDPLVADVARRWKQVFAQGGLKLSADGRISRQVGSRSLPFGSLSGGEKVWALLLTRLLISAASTTSPFVWLDEPLEHLDPRLRKIVAGTLAAASAGVGLRQVLVTTYEVDLAQQLMEDVPSASLIFVTSTD